MRPLANIELNPTKPKNQSEETRSDSFNYRACVGAEPGRVTRDFMSVS